MPVRDDVEISIVTVFCNESERTETFEDTRWGRISARDRFWEVRDEAKMNDSILARFPHIIQVRFHGDHVEPVIEEYECRETREKKKAL